MMDFIFPYFRAILRYKWLGLWMAWGLCIAGWAAIMIWPDKYESTAKVHIDTQSILEPLLKGMAIQPDLAVRVELMSKVLLSRPNLDRVVRMADLDISAETEDDLEALITKLRSSIDVKSAGSSNLYTLSARYISPEDSKLIVQSLLSIFVEEIQGKAREESDQASRFLDSQVQAYELRLSEAERNLEEFKREHIGDLPQEGVTHYKSYQDTSVLLEKAKLDLQEALNKRDALRRQMQGDEPTFLGLGSKKGTAVNGNYDARISQLQQTRDDLLLKFTEKHPKVIATSRLLTDLLKKKSQTSGSMINNSALLLTENLSPLQKSTYFQQLTVALGQAEGDAAALQARVAEYTSRLAAGKKHMNSALDVETQLQGLNRDYSIIKQRYKDLLARRETAHLSEKVEQTKVVKFRIVEPPSLPLKAVSPNRPLLSVVILVFAILAGIASAIVRSMIYPTFNSVKQLSAALGRPILGSVEAVVLPQLQNRDTWSRFGFVFASLALIACFVGMLVITTPDTHEMVSGNTTIDMNILGNKGL